MRGLFPEAWRLRANLTFSDAMYVALAKHLGADLLTDDQKLANAANRMAGAIPPPSSVGRGGSCAQRDEAL